MKSSTPLKALLFAGLSLALPATAEAATLAFDGGGNSLTVTVTDLPVFTITADGGNTRNFILKFDDVYATVPPESASGWAMTSIQISHNGGPTFPSPVNLAYAGEPGLGTRSVSLVIGRGPFDPNGVDIKTGDTIRISDFSLTFDNSNLRRSYTLPTSADTASVRLTSGGNLPITGSSAIPEPSSILLGLLGSLALLRRRR